jgi:hypothetical protein
MSVCVCVCVFVCVCVLLVYRADTVCGRAQAVSSSDKVRAEVTRGGSVALRVEVEEEVEPQPAAPVAADGAPALQRDQRQAQLVKAAEKEMRRTKSNSSIRHTAGESHARVLPFVQHTLLSTALHTLVLYSTLLYTALHTLVLSAALFSTLLSIPLSSAAHSSLHTLVLSAALLSAAPSSTLLSIPLSFCSTLCFACSSDSANILSHVRTCQSCARARAHVIGSHCYCFD